MGSPPRTDKLRRAEDKKKRHKKKWVEDRSCISKSQSRLFIFDALAKTQRMAPV